MEYFKINVAGVERDLPIVPISDKLSIAAFVIFDRRDFLTLAASLVGVTSLILNAKGNPVGQALMILFSIFYGIISYSFSYYGEMITYLGMTAPMALVALIAWLRHPYKGNRAQVTVGRLKGKGEVLLLCALTAAVTVVFYFILGHFHTVNLIPSTLSVTTSFVAVYLTALRSPYYALGYALNDVVLVVLWVLATIEDASYAPMIACFVMFLANDLYGFVNWRRMQVKQEK